MSIMSAHIQKPVVKKDVEVPAAATWLELSDDCGFDWPALVVAVSGGTV